MCNSRKHVGTVDVRSSNMEQVWTRTIFTLLLEFIFGLLCNNAKEHLLDFVISWKCGEFEDAALQAVFVLFFLKSLVYVFVDVYMFFKTILCSFFKSSQWCHEQKDMCAGIDIFQISSVCMEVQDKKMPRKCALLYLRAIQLAWLISWVIIVLFGFW